MSAPTLSHGASPDHRCLWPQASTRRPWRDHEAASLTPPECVASPPTPQALPELQAAFEAWLVAAIAPVRFNLDDAAAALLAAIFEFQARPQPLPSAQERKIGAAAPASGAKEALIDALRQMAADASNADHPNLAHLLSELAAWSLARRSSDTGRAARELGIAAARARKSGWLAAAETIWRESLRIDPRNVRSRSSLGQLLHSRGRHEEAIALLEPVRGTDNYARYFLGLSQICSSAHGDARWHAGLDNVGAALRTWAIGADDGARTAWLKQVRMLWAESLCQPAAEQLIAFADRHAHWRTITLDEVRTAAMNGDRRTDTPSPGADQAPLPRC